MTFREKMNSSGVSVVLGSYNRLKFLKYTVQSIRNEMKDADFPHEIIVIDGGSNDGSLEWLMKQKDIITIVQHNWGKWEGKSIERRSWGYFMNLGFKSSQGKYICMLSDDCLVIPGAIKFGYAKFENELKKGVNAGALAFYWRNWPEFEKYVVFKFYGLINVNHGLFLRDALDKVGFIDEDNFMFYAGDVDLSFKLNHAGYKLLISDNSFIEHYMHANNKTRVKNLDSFESDNSNFIKKWSAVYPEMDFSPENRSSLIEKGFVDETDTVKIFRKESGFVRLKYKARSIISGKSE
ncbi:MAG: glycosyltransferase [Bacteroidetes bacterium]|nr:MAG: glycosyltransferase [Bacteroidota bacterium]